MLKDYSEKEIRTIFNMIKLLDKDFKKIWAENKKILSNYVELLRVLWMKKGEAAVKEIESFLNLRVPKTITVYVLYSPSGSGGGANLGKKGITFEIGDLRQSPTRHFYTLMHKLVHFTEQINNRERRKHLKN